MSGTSTLSGRCNTRISTYLLVATIAISGTFGLFSLALSSTQNAAPCAQVATAAARLACYDQRDHAVTAPAKGATAPALPQ